jgi:transcription antitermination factor NusG
MNSVEIGQDDTGYYALHVRHRGEMSIAEALRRRGYTVLLPNSRHPSPGHSKSQDALTPLFPGYLFVEASLRGLSQLAYIRGVNSVVKTAGTLRPIPVHEIASIRLLCEDPGDCRPCESLTKGQRVRIDSGPFSGFEGILIREPDRYRVVISFHCLCSSVAVDLRDTHISTL